MDVQTTSTTTAEATMMKRVFLTICCSIVGISLCCLQLTTRLYFIHGGTRLWFSSWLQTGAWPINLLPLLVAYSRRQRQHKSSAGTKIIYIKPRALTCASAIGVLTGLGDYILVYGASKLPVSTSSLILSSQLAFTATFAFLLVKQKFTPFSVNAVVLLTLASAILGIHMSGDRPPGETSRSYLLGFVMTVGTAMLFGLVFPLIELTYRKAKQVVTFTLVMEIQVVIAFVATAVCTLGMVINSDFQAISGEAKAYGLGEKGYYLVIVWIAISCQTYNLAALGVIFYSSSLLLGIVVAVFLPVTELLAVIIFREKFQVDKGISLFLSLWGFISYFYGEIKHNAAHSNNVNNKATSNLNKAEGEEETTVAP